MTASVKGPLGPNRADMSAQSLRRYTVVDERPYLEWLTEATQQAVGTRSTAGLSTRGVTSPGRMIPVHFEKFSFGSMQIDGRVYDFDLVIDRGEIRKRKKKASKRYRDAYGHTPVSVDEDIPWRCRRLVIGTGAESRLPVMPEVEKDAQRRKVELVVLPTKDAISILNRGDLRMNAILHVTC
jgi:hypothetical protein